MPHKSKPTTTPDLIDKAKSCTSAKEVIQTLFSIKRIPNGLDRKEAKKIFLKEGIPWPNARGRKRKGEFVVKKISAKKIAREIAREIMKNGSRPVDYPEPEGTPDRPDPIPRSPVAFCPACGAGIYECIDRPCEGCKRDLTIEIYTRTIYSITAK